MPTRKMLITADIVLAVLFAAVCAAAFFVLRPAAESEPMALPNLVSAQDGTVTVIAETTNGNITPETVWTDGPGTEGDFTLPDAAALDGEGCIGVVTVPSVGIRMNVYETDDAMEDMKKGAAHFKSTSAWEGNVGLSGHNYTTQFGPLTSVHEGDVITYETALGTRYYHVSTIAEIADDDWSYLDRTDDNRITLITCVVGQDTRRLVVQAVEF